MTTDRRAWLWVSDEVEQYFRLPDGFREVWRDGCFRLIEGPFPATVADGSTVGAELTADLYGGVFWRWLDGKTWEPISEPMELS